MVAPQQDASVQPPPGAAPTILSFSRAHLSAAKKKKKTYWRVEVCATILSVAASLVPIATIAVVLAVLSVASKAIGKLKMSAAKKLFRIGERQRRYDFYKKTLGWDPPPRDRADTHIQNSGEKIRAEAAKLAPHDRDYYAHKGPPSTERLFCNLAESMFWSERLFGALASMWWQWFAAAVTLVGAVLVMLIIAHPNDHALLALKLLSSVVALLVAIDVFGEAKSSSRGEREVKDLLRVLEKEMATQTPSHDEALRLLIEYNCLLADLPMIPDAVHRAHEKKLNAAWKEYEKGLPFRCAVAAADTQEPALSEG